MLSAFMSKPLVLYAESARVAERRPCNRGSARSAAEEAQREGREVPHIVRGEA